jgi:hypothetical protein
MRANGFKSPQNSATHGSPPKSHNNKTATTIQLAHDVPHGKSRVNQGFKQFHKNNRHGRCCFFLNAGKNIRREKIKTLSFQAA